MKPYYSKTYLATELKIKTPLEIAKINNVSVKTIYRAKCRLNLAKHKNLWSERDTNLLISNYSHSPIVYTLFPARTKVSINKKAYKLGLERIQRVSRNNYTVNDKFFDEWTSESAYVFGWLCSDGNVSKDKTYFQIHLNKKDIKILESINKLMESNSLITEYKNSIRLIVYNKKLTQRLIELGCLPKKSLSLKFPAIPDQYLSHFMRGYFDGDGSIFFNKPNTIKIKLIGTRSFLTSAQNLLFLKFNLKKHPIIDFHSVAFFEYYGDDARKFCSLIYQDSKGMFLERKYKRYINHMKLRLSYG